MKLLIVTQAVDREHPVLGFFHRWISECARHCSQVVVIAQQEGDHAFPPHVRVISLGKERGVSRPRQILRFWSILWRERDSFDGVLVHMTPVWVLLGWPILRVLRRPLFLWYEVRRGGAKLRLAARLCRLVFSATASGVPFPIARHRVLGHGIDTAQFAPGDLPRDALRLVAVGRVTRIKRIELLLDALAALPSDYHLDLIGMPVTSDDQVYLAALQRQAEQQGTAERWTIRTLPHDALPAALRTAGMFLHAGAGGLDKALLEAMACACPVVTTSPAADTLVPQECRAVEASFANAVCAMASRSVDEKNALGNAARETVCAHHDLSRLIEQLCDAMAASCSR